jgi:hypothetical protein
VEINTRLHVLTSVNLDRGWPVLRRAEMKRKGSVNIQKVRAELQALTPSDALQALGPRLNNQRMCFLLRRGPPAFLSVPVFVFQYPFCRKTSNIKPALGRVLNETQQAVEQCLSRISLAQVIADLRKK